MTAKPAFDFDEWKKLAQNDPAEFEHRRKQRIENAIEACPSSRQQRLRGLQFRIDVVRRTRSPLGACIRVSEMMMEQVHERFQPVLLGDLSTAIVGKPAPEHRAEVVKLPVRNTKPTAKR